MKKFGICQDHKEPYTILYLQKDYKDNRLACSQCLMKDQNKNLNCVPLSLISKKPEELFEKILANQDSYHYYLKQMISASSGNELAKIFDEQEIKFLGLTKVIDQVITLLRQQKDAVIKCQKDIKLLKEQFLEDTGYNSFIRLLKDLDTLGKNSDKQEQNLLVTKCSEEINKMQENNCNQIKIKINAMRVKHFEQSKLQVHNYYPRSKLTDIKQFLTILEKAINDYRDFSDEITSKNYPQLHDCPVSSIAYKNFFHYIVGTINEKTKNQVSKITKLYTGKEDGLGNEQIWKKVLKGNVLMFFKSNQGNVFGVYTPCQCYNNSAYQAYLSDDSLASFIFSQADYVIYPLRPEKKGSAVRTYYSMGPCFGEGDLIIPANFQGCTSNLGISYDFNINTQNRTSLLLGAEKANIIECEVYQIAF